MAVTLNASASAGFVQTADTSTILQLQTNSTTALTIDGSQNVGIGTASPTAKLHINGASTQAYISNSAGSGIARLNIKSTTNDGYQYCGIGLQNGTNDAEIMNTTNGLSFSFPAGLERIVINSSGNVGVGTGSPLSTSQLTVASKSLSVTGSDGNFSAGGNRAVLDLTTNLVRFGGCAGGAASAVGLALQYGPVSGGSAEAARIDSSGNLLVGTSNTSTTNGGFVFFPSYARTGSSTCLIGHISGSASGESYFQFQYNGSGIGSITQNGTTGVLYNITSDHRLKNNPVALTGAKEFVMALQPKTWDWHDGSGKGVGFIAHEFMEVAKYSGNGEKDAVDADGNPVYQSIQPSSSEVMANLVAFIQELNAKVEAQAAEIAQLKGNA